VQQCARHRLVTHADEDLAGRVHSVEHGKCQRCRSVAASDRGGDPRVVRRLGYEAANRPLAVEAEREVADALSWLVASRSQILDVVELETRGAADAVAAEGLAGTVQFLSDLCHTQAAQAAGEVSRICAELVFGYTRHPSWDEQEHRNCFLAAELEELEETMPGIMAMAVDVLQPDGSHPAKAGPCAGCAGSSEFLRLQSKLTTCLTGARLAKDRAADTVSKVMIPEALDYPAAGPA